MKFIIKPKENKMANLYELNEQLQNIDSILENSTDSETNEILESAKEEILKEIDGKVENILNYVDDCKARCEQLKANEERLNKKRKSLEKRVDYLKNLVMYYMKSNNLNKATFDNWDVSVAKTAGKVVLDINEESLPSWCKKVTYTADKTVLKSQMIDGKAYIEGEDGNPLLIAHMETLETIRIK